jgi:hypothetical protein
LPPGVYQKISGIGVREGLLVPGLVWTFIDVSSVAKNNIGMALRFSPSSSAAGPRLPRFGLRTLLVGMAILSALFAVMSKIGMLWSVMLVWSFLLIAAHVLGNAWGSQTFRSRGSRHEDEQPAHNPSCLARATGIAPVEPEEILLRHAIPGGRSRAAMSAASAVLLGLAGGTFFTFFYGTKASLGGIAVWYLSCAVIGAIAGFVGGGFLQIFSIVTGPPRSRRS